METDPVSVEMVKVGTLMPVSSIMVISLCPGSLIGADMFCIWLGRGMYFLDGFAFNDRKTVFARHDTTAPVKGR
jgi:hypothetical protein